MKLSILRLTQQKSKTMNENEAKKREVAELLREGQEHKAEIKATSIIMNDYRVEVYTQLIIYLNLLLARYELLLAQHSCPAELKEACCAIVYASPHLSEQNELANCRLMLLARFGRQFPNQCMDEQVIHPKITTRLSARTPDQTVVNYYVTSIAREYNVTSTHLPSDDTGDNFGNGDVSGDNFSNNDVIIPCTPSRVLAPVDPSKGTAYGPGLQDGVVGQQSLFTIDLTQCGDVNERVVVLVSGPEETRIVGDVVPNGDNTFAASYVPPLPGNYAVAVYCGDKHIGNGRPWVLNVRDISSPLSLPSDPRMCSASGDGLIGGFAGIQSKFTITARTSDGNQCTNGGDTFSVFVSGPNDARIKGDVLDNNNGTYDVTYVPPYPGQYALAIFNGKTPIGDGNPWVFDVLDAPAELDPSKCTAEGEGLLSPLVECQAIFNITAIATDGSIRSAGGDRFDVLISGPNDTRMRGDVIDNKDGTYTAVYTPPYAGTYAIAVYANGSTIIGNGSPIIVDVTSQPTSTMSQKSANPACAAKCTTDGDGLSEGVVDMLACFTIHAFDRFGAPCEGGGEEFSVFISGPGVQITADVMDNKDGTYFVSYIPPTEGTYIIAIMLGTDPIGDGSVYNAVITGGSGKIGGDEDDLMARFAMLRAGDAPVSSEAPMSNDEDDLMAKFNALKGGDTSNELPMDPEEDDLMAKFNALKGGDTNNELPMDPEEDDLMAKFNALKGGDTNNELPMDPEEDDLMAKFNALKGGDTSNELPMDPEEDDLMAKFNALKASDTSNELPMNPEEDDLMAKFNALKGPTLGSAGFLATSVPKPQHFDPLPNVPISNLFAVRKRKASFASFDVDKCVVLDNGSGTVKCGIAGMPQPLAFLPTVIGRPLYKSVLPMINSDTIYVGDEAKRKKGVLSLEYPIEHGVIRDWNAMESVWHHTFLNELRIDPASRPIVMAEHTLLSHETREKSAEIMFEKFGVPGFFAASQAALALHSVGIRTGVVVDIGDCTIQTTAIVDGEILTHAARRAEFGGRDCTELFINLLSKEGVFLGDTSSERDIARDIKEKLGYVARNYETEMGRARNDVVAQYSLPDGDVAHIYQSRFSCAEPLFKPKMVGKDTLSLPQMVATSILKSPEGARKELAKNIVVIGGSSLFGGLPERLLSELNGILSGDLAPKSLVLPENRSCAAWLGGSMLGSNIDNYQCLCITKEEYNESGSSALSFMK